MAEFCHVCDLFRTALFGPTNSNEDHLDDGQGNDLPRPMADAPATLAARSRARPGTTAAAKARASPDVITQPSGGSGATATPSVTSEIAAPTPSRVPNGAAGGDAELRGPAALPAAPPAAVTAAAAAATTEPVIAMPSGKPPPKTRFSKRASRGLKSAPAYMSFDDVDVEDDDSDGELFIEDSRDRRGSGSRSPGSIAAAASSSAAAYSVNAPSVYREPKLSAPQTALAPAAAAASPAPAALAPAAPADDAPPAPAYDSAAVPLGGGIPGSAVDEGVRESDYVIGDAVAVGGGGGGGEYATGGAGRNSSAVGVQGSDGGSVSSRGAIAGDSSMEAFPSGPGKGTALRLGIGERVSIPRDGSVLESARPHGQSESFHGYKGYPGYEPDTPVNAQLPMPGRSTDALTIGPGADVSDPRNQKGLAAPTPSSTRRYEEEDPRAVEAALDSARSEGRPAEGLDGQYPVEAQHQQHSVISPSGTADIGSAVGGAHMGHVQVTSNRPPQHVNPGTGLSYAESGMGSNYRPSPAHSAANSMASSFRREEGRSIQQQPSEDGIGSVLGTLAGTEDSANEDLQWKRSALKKFHKVMVKGEGLRVVKHNRSGGSQVRIIRYDPDIKALVWNSKRYMKKAGSANVPIVGIKRVGREGNTVSITAAGRGTIGFEPQRIRDAKILTEALRALVDKEERSAMWRG